MKQLKVRIIDNRRLTKDFYRLRVESPFLAKNIKPGQFVDVRCSEGLNPLLRRPFSVHRILRSGIEILYEIVGKGTKVLSERKPGELLDIIGPLGNGFDTLHHSATYAVAEGQPRRLTRHYTLHILVAGGMGVAPLVALAEGLAYSVQRTAYREKAEIYVLIGAKIRNHIVCKDDFKKIGCKIFISTEDGSKGNKGLVTESLKSLLSTINYSLSTIYACGPNEMLKEVAKIAKDRRILCQVSLEERMACGVGACLGCPVKVREFASSRVREFASSRVRGSKLTNSRTHEPTNYTYKMVCKDGPVFNAEDIAW